MAAPTSEVHVLIFCGLFIAFLAGAGFLFGQLFAGHFSVSATLTGVAGLASAVGAFLLFARPNQSIPWVRWAALLTLLGVALNIISYYMYFAIPGNYYAWFLVAPFAVCVAWVGYTAQRHHRYAAAVKTMPTENIENNYRTFFLWGVGFVISSFVLSLLGVLVPWHPLQVLIHLLSFASDFGACICFVIGGWKAIQIWRSASQQAQAKSNSASQNGYNT